MVDFRKVRGYHKDMIMLCHVDHSTARHRVGGKPDPRRTSIADDLVIVALQPLRILQIGVPGQLLDGRGDVAVWRIRSLDEGLGALAKHEFDAIVLGADVVDAWPTAAYERIAELAGATPVVVQADFIEPMASIKQQQLREHDIVVATAKSSLLGRMALTAILRNRALAQEPGTEIG